MILLDTDILLDVALDRSEHVEPAAALLRHLEVRPKTAFVAWHTLSNVYYLIKSSRGGEDARHFVGDLTGFVLVAPTDTDEFRFATKLGLSDFEDCMQVAAARACGARAIVTRNTKDFRASPIPAISPTEALDFIN